MELRYYIKDDGTKELQYNEQLTENSGQWKSLPVAYESPLAEYNEAAEAKILRKDIDPIVDICGETIDLRKVERVGEITGSSDWHRYSVYFTGGNKLEIYDKRKYADSHKVTQMGREEFVELWRFVSKS